ncbi:MULTISPECIES: hypothetical protein [unclassified Meiothermus]|uniref:hypothetical protein n=1 Tax=unclassified Meiothermus TaxID=370471 RepID=UPI000D7C0964|nr:MULTISPECIES: hypothetical protein [unclassified Meiothermus]PZA05862.1 hypothetical protein DNA98_16410 [Meiothermus sp. Pnk-1]RYM30742.1 hypothetical protein EWH23_15220 [Meiothermus sp. PNK-Is4]
MEINQFINEVSDAYEQVGRPILEGRLVALLLTVAEPQTLGELATALEVSKSALLKVVRPMVERGDLKRWREPKTRQHSIALAGPAYIHDLRLHLISGRRVLGAVRALLAQPDLDKPVRERLFQHAQVVEAATSALEKIVHTVEEQQIQDLQRHLEQDWDALPPRKGRGRAPRLT